MARSSTFNTLLLLSFILVISTNAINQNIFNINNDERNTNNNNNNIINHHQQRSEDNFMKIVNIDKLVGHMVNMLCGFNISPMLYIYFPENLQTTIAEQLIQFVSGCMIPLEIVR